VFNYAFESPEVVSFIRKNYPDVAIRRAEMSYFQLIKKRQFLPTKEIRYCCDYFKEACKSALVTGVRREESAGRKSRKMLALRKKSDFKKYANVFQASCMESGKSSPLALLPILYFSEAEVWRYIQKYNLPYPSLYDDGQRRCGCMLCPLSGLKGNLYHIKKYPNLLPSFYRNVARKLKLDFTFHKNKSSMEDLSNSPYSYLLYWLSASFRPSKKEKEMIDKYLIDNNLK
jgi:phosphoadenosine phosphosulfate reductase